MCFSFCDVMVRICSFQADILQQICHFFSRFAVFSGRQVGDMGDGAAGRGEGIGSHEPVGGEEETEKKCISVMNSGKSTTKLCIHLKNCKSTVTMTSQRLKFKHPVRNISFLDTHTMQQSRFFFMNAFLTDLTGIN